MAGRKILRFRQVTSAHLKFAKLSQPLQRDYLWINLTLSQTDVIQRSFTKELFMKNFGAKIPLPLRQNRTKN